MRITKSAKWGLTVAVATAAAVGGAALAATNTAPATNAGQKATVNSGYTVTNVTWNPTLTGGGTGPGDSGVVALSSVAFHIVRVTNTSGVNTADTNIKIVVKYNGGTLTPWITCTSSSGDATCDVSSQGITMDQIEGINVLAYDKTNSA